MTILQVAAALEAAGLTADEAKDCAETAHAHHIVHGVRHVDPLRKDAHYYRGEETSARRKAEALEAVIAQIEAEEPS